MRPIILALAVVFTLTSIGCCKPGTTSKWCTVKQVAVDCGAPAIQQAVADLLPAVQAILTSGSPDWEAQLTALEAVGVSVVICAVEKAVSLISGSGASLSSMARARGKLYLKHKGVR